ncbi:hypothetical protein L596_007559 [Steinernema carpocapsae]|uniref:Uncharacterized protein n=1 Tax=Steinernema carpocapsae TaxID=34508 RepID=A0A4U5P9U9_STECR|nr:hypothetical protein L596_007559 [Steinernema carpocapsae]
MEINFSPVRVTRASYNRLHKAIKTLLLLSPGDHLSSRRFRRLRHLGQVRKNGPSPIKSCLLRYLGSGHP